jgi:hypothetical protein
VNHLLAVRRPSPALVISALALFFAIGGSAFAVGQRVGVAQPRCANGAVKAFAHVSGDPARGIHDMAETFSSDPKLFKASFNCSGKGVQVRRVRNVFEVRFPGAPVRTVVASATGSLTIAWSVTPLPDGSFRIAAAGVDQPSFQLGPQYQFLVVAV